MSGLVWVLVWVACGELVTVDRVVEDARGSDRAVVEWSSGELESVPSWQGAREGGRYWVPTGCARPRG